MSGNICLPEAPSIADCELTKPFMSTIDDSVTDRTRAEDCFYNGQISPRGPRVAGMKRKLSHEDITTLRRSKRLSKRRRL